VPPLAYVNLSPAWSRAFCGTKLVTLARSFSERHQPLPALERLRC
jgi:hypothetical protein